MRTFTTTTTVYKLNELSKQAQEKAYQYWQEYVSEIYHHDEIEDTLKKFCSIFDVNCHSWEYDEYRHSFRFLVNCPLAYEDLEGIRLAKFVYNNYGEYITKGKYFSLWSKKEKSELNPNMGKLKFRHSKVLLSTDDCPLTGVCYDIDVLQPIIDCINYKKIFNSYEELIQECLTSLFDSAVRGYEYSLSKEAFIEDSEANDWEYLEDGTIN